MKYKNIKIGILLFFGVVICVSLIFITNHKFENPIESNLNLEEEIPDEKVMISEEYPGAMVKSSNEFNVAQTDRVKPSVQEANQDIGQLYNDDCNQVEGKSEIISCHYGDEQSNFKIALVGGSHTVQWFDSIKLIADHRNYSLTTMTKLGCRFTTENLADKSCVEWNKNVINELLEENYDLVITNADISTSDYPEVPEGYLEHFRNLESHDIPVLGVRDTPWFNNEMIQCVKENQDSLEECAVKSEELLVSPTKWDELSDPPSNVYYFDISDILCDSNLCKPVQGNVLIYWDTHHVTATYSKSTAPFFDEQIIKIIKNENISVY